MLESSGMTNQASLPCERTVPNISDERRKHKDPYRRADNGRSGGASHALRTAGSAHAVETSDQGDDDGEHKGLEQTLKEIVVFESLPGGGPIFGERQSQHRAGDKIAADQADEIRNDGQEREYRGQRDQAGRYQFLNGIGAEGAHGIDLLGD